MQQRRRQIVAFLLVFLFVTLSRVGIVIAEGEANKAVYQVNPIAQVWKQVREGTSGYSSVRGQETGELIQGSGQIWRQLRNGPIATYAGWLLGATALAIMVFFFFRGKVKLTKPRSGNKLTRWSVGERALHWYTALLFLILTATGLSLLYGRAFLIPYIGKAEFAVYADIVILLHNLLGPLFIVGLLLMIIVWFKDNLPSRIDLRWILECGGFIGNKHPSAGRMNAGEKLWYWLLASAGVAVCITGLILDFPNFGQDRFIIQISHLIHLILAMVLIVGALGHIYVGTIGTEGAFEGMISGQVDESWAEQHHDVWCEEVKVRTGESGDESGSVKVS